MIPPACVPEDDTIKTLTSEETKANIFEDNIIRTTQITTEEMTIDDEDELLYGSSKTDFPFFKNSSGDQMDTGSSEVHDRATNDEGETTPSGKDKSAKPVDETVTSYWLATVNMEGVLNILRICENDISEMYSVNKFNMAPNTLILNNLLTGADSKCGVAKAVLATRSSLVDSFIPQVHEILIISIGK